MPTDANQLQKGQLIEFNNAIWKIVNKEDITPGRRSAIVQLELKNISTGSKLYQRFVSDTRIEVATSDSFKAQYLYKDNDFIYVMNTQTYDQDNYSLSLIDAKTIPFLQDNMILTIETANDKPFLISLPQNGIYEIIETPPYMKGQTEKPSSKIAKLDCGATIKVPDFIEIGTKVVVNIAEQSYLEKAKLK